jgi:hypothetical protein
MRPLSSFLATASRDLARVVARTLLWFFPLLLPLDGVAAPAISNLAVPVQVGRYQKLEVTFDITGTVAQNFQLPYDPAPPAGIDPNYSWHQGISVDAEFSANSWQTIYRQPAFYYHRYQDGIKQSWDGSQQEWFYPTGQNTWAVRFAPNSTGTWQGRITARDASGATVSATFSFSVVASTSKGFLHVSKNDPRYFEFDDGTPFISTGLEAGGHLDNPVTGNQPDFVEFQKNHIKLLRNWISSLYGSGWLEWIGGRNLYDGYLPRSGLVPIHDTANARDVMTQTIAYPEYWFDACRFQFWSDPEAVKPNTNYRLTVTYLGQNITAGGPRVASSPNYGLVAMVSTNWQPNCYEPGTPGVVTNYGKDTGGTWGTIQGTWNSGSNNFLPRIYLGLNNVNPSSGTASANILAISLREDLGAGQLGPELLRESSLQYELYFPDGEAYALDKYVDLAQQYDIYLKLVVMELNDEIWRKMNNDGTFVLAGQDDNMAGFYGLGRPVNKTRWLQQAWWRYLQARWGYSTSIHSWELVNEGDPFSTAHWQMTDEFAKYMRCRVFGVTVGSADAQACTFAHPNRHLTTTSFWTSFPGYDPASGNGFWGSPKYPNPDYADAHAYITSSWAPTSERILMQSDSTYYHLWHSRDLAGWKFKFPIVRGEAGMTPYNTNTNDWGGLGIERDTAGVWYHNFIWSSLDSGALYENYWYYVDHVNDSGVYDHRPSAKTFYEFMQNVPVNNGSYSDAAVVVSDANLRVVGQKDTSHGQAYLWIQNKNHEWLNVVNGTAIAPITGTVQIPGLAAGRSYTVQWWDPYQLNPASQVTKTEALTAGSNGTLTLSVSSLTTDVAVQVRAASVTIAPTVPKGLRVIP